MKGLSSLKPEAFAFEVYQSLSKVNIQKYPLRSCQKMQVPGHVPHDSDGGGLV